MAILKPGDPGFSKVLGASKGAFGQYTKDEIDMNSTASVETVEKVVLERDKFTVEAAKVVQNEALRKLVFHFKKVSRKTMTDLSAYMANHLTQRIKPRAAIQAGESPIYRDQWDLILLHVPVFEADMLFDTIVTLINNF